MSKSECRCSHACAYVHTRHLHILLSTTSLLITITITTTITTVIIFIINLCRAASIKVRRYRASSTTANTLSAGHVVVECPVFRRVAETRVLIVQTRGAESCRGRTRNLRFVGLPVGIVISESFVADKFNNVSWPPGVPKYFRHKYSNVSEPSLYGQPYPMIYLYKCTYKETSARAVRKTLPPLSLFLAMISPPALDLSSL